MHDRYVPSLRGFGDHLVATPVGAITTNNSYSIVDERLDRLLSDLAAFSLAFSKKKKYSLHVYFVLFLLQSFFFLTAPWFSAF